jgi:hypothetical protein
MILDRLSILASFLPARGAAAAVAKRWRAAAARDPELVADVVRIGGILQLQPARFQDGLEQPDPIDPVRLAYEAGRRDMALRFVALMGITITELNSLMEDTP